MSVHVFFVFSSPSPHPHSFLAPSLSSPSPPSFPPQPDALISFRQRQLKKKKNFFTFYATKHSCKIKRKKRGIKYFLIYFFFQHFDCVRKKNIFFTLSVGLRNIQCRMKITLFFHSLSLSLSLSPMIII